MKFQIILAAIFGAFVSSKGSWGGYKSGNYRQNVDLKNIADADAASFALNCGCGDAIAKSNANAGNCNDVDQKQYH